MFLSIVASRRSSIEFSWISPFHLPSKFLFLARSANRTSWLGAASARSSSWWVGGSVGPSGGIATGGGRGIITGGPAAAPSGRARPPDVWCRELWAAIGPLLVRFVGSVATGGCTAADIDRSTPPSSTGRQPPEAPLPLTAGRIPPPPGSGAYGKYSSSLRASSCNRVEDQFPARSSPFTPDYLSETNGLSLRGRRDAISISIKLMFDESTTNQRMLRRDEFIEHWR